MASTTYKHPGCVTEMYAAREQFRNLTKMVCVCLRGLTKTYHLDNVTVMVRNAGQLPEPFWLGASCGGGSRGAATVPART